MKIQINITDKELSISIDDGNGIKQILPEKVNGHAQPAELPKAPAAVEKHTEGFKYQPKTCKQCGEEFTPTHGRQMSCRQCRDKKKAPKKGK